MPQTIVPFIAYEDAAAAIDWLTDAFGFRENTAARYMDGDTVTHAEMDVGDGSVVYLASPSPDYQSPRRHRETCAAAARWSDNPWVIDGHLIHVDDVDAHHAQARAAGALILREPENAEAAGARLYSAEDLEGHRWMFEQR
jgi:uncharacterized glyoxalase superfamily protein PhnB